MTKEEYNHQFEELSASYQRIDVDSILKELNNLYDIDYRNEKEQDKIDELDKIIHKWNKRVQSMHLIYGQLVRNGIKNIKDPTQYTIEIIRQD